ncbi:hypothetical protein EG329_011205 [Mollisiaceae sp. DMI_Dod_QoI]|nr:hypothetical protein EG329_011205 [Helotiales sp. DMI_Dod_QoI]
MLTNRKDSSNPSSSSMHCTLFTCFARLPLELQLRVWRDASFHPRNVDIWVTPSHLRPSVEDLKEYHEHHTQAWVSSFRSTCLPPAILHCCQGSRKEGLKHYKLNFGFCLKLQNGFNFTQEARIYINWRADTLCVMNPNSYGLVSSEKLCALVRDEGLQSIAVAVDLSWNGMDELHSMAPYTIPSSPWLNVRSDEFPISLTAKTLVHDASGVILTWEVFTEKFKCIKKHLEDIRDMMQREVKLHCKQQDLSPSPTTKAPSDLVTYQGPDIKVCDVSYDFIYGSRRKAKAD